MFSKPVILLCWGYNRSGWIYVFEKLKQDFEFVYIYYRSIDEEKNPVTDARKIYWDDYTSGKDIIKKIKPVSIVFMAITSGYAIGLNSAAKSMEIPTIILQHGLFRTYQEYRILEQMDKANPRKTSITTANKPGSGFTRTFKFLLRSLPLSSIFSLPRLLLYFYIQRKKGVYYATAKVFLKYRLADRYICYSPRNAEIHKYLDHISDDDIVYIGVPELDPFFDNAALTPEKKPGKYHLLIDQPFAENQYFNLPINTDQMNEVYEKLASWCESNDSKLLIKLHPESYKSTWLLKRPSITYVRDANVVELIKNATGIFGTTSTLMLPAIYLKPVFLLLIHDSSFQQSVLDLGLAKGSDFFHFSVRDIEFIEDKNEEKLTQFEQDFLFKADGKSAERLKLLIKGLNPSGAPYEFTSI